MGFYFHHTIVPSIAIFDEPFYHHTLDAFTGLPKMPIIFIGFFYRKSPPYMRAEILELNTTKVFLIPRNMLSYFYTPSRRERAICDNSATALSRRIALILWGRCVHPSTLAGFIHYKHVSVICGLWKRDQCIHWIYNSKQEGSKWAPIYWLIRTKIACEGDELERSFYLVFVDQILTAVAIPFDFYHSFSWYRLDPHFCYVYVQPTNCVQLK